MSDITIPPAAFTAGREAFYNAEANRKSTDDAIRAAFLAMLATAEKIAGARIAQLESDLSDALTDLNTARQDNASCTAHIHNQAARIEKLEAALREIDTACTNAGSWSPVVMERIIERVQELSRAALEERT